jgi:hypothetical protein
MMTLLHGLCPVWIEVYPHEPTGIAAMTLDLDRSRRSSRRLLPAVEAMEGRTLLSAGAGTVHPFREKIVALAASRRVSLRGTLTGTINPTTTDGKNFVVIVTLRGPSGNARLGTITIQAGATATAAQLGNIGRGTLTAPGLPLELTTAGGTATAIGTMTISRSRSLARVPFRLTATLRSGTGQLAGATGSFTLQGNDNAITGAPFRAQLRGTLHLGA